MRRPLPRVAVRPVTAPAAIVPLMLAALAGCVAAAFLLGSYEAFLLGQVALLVIAGVGMNIMIGLNGQISFGHAGFYAIGAYAVALATTRGWAGFWIAWPSGVAVAAALGALLSLPALRVKGPYLAMVTIAFGIVTERALSETGWLTGGQNGVLAIATVPLPSFIPEDRATIVTAILTAAAMLVAGARVRASAWGAAMQAVRDSDVAAASIGIDVTRVRVMAFTLSAGAAALAGGLFAPMNGFVTPNAFDLNASILLVLVVIVGGAGSVAGPLLGAIVVALLPELLASFEGYRVLAYGGLVLLVLRIAPHGIAGLLARSRRREAVVAETPALRALLRDRPRRGLRASGLSIAFGGVRAIDAVDLDAPAGAISALIGPNGAGKSTLLNLLAGFYAADAGERALGAMTLVAGKPSDAARHGIARTYQTSLLFGSLSVETNLLLAARCGRLGHPLGRALSGIAPAERARLRDLLAATGCSVDPAAAAGSLAHVDRRLAEIARALAMDPDILLLDEPAAGLSREEKAALGALLRQIAAAGIGVCLVEHDMSLVMAVSDSVTVLCSGKRIASGTPETIQADPVVRRAYLGEPGEPTGRAARQPDSRPGSAGVAMAGYALHAGYGAIEVLHGPDIELRQGRTVVLLGSNGAGKSTLMKCLAGLVTPRAGHIRIGGVDATNASTADRVRQGVVLVPEGRQLFPALTVADNIRLGAYRRRDGANERMAQIQARFPLIVPLVDRPAGLLSGGEQQMVALARALMTAPDILLLDEPSLGLAPLIAETIFDQLRALGDGGMTIMIVDQMAAAAIACADTVSVMADGRIVASGPPETMLDSDLVATAYLGDGSGTETGTGARLPVTAR